MEDYIFLKNPNECFLITFFIIFCVVHFYIKLFDKLLKDHTDIYSKFIFTMLIINFVPGIFNIFVQNHTFLLGIFEMLFASTIIYKLFFVRLKRIR